MTLDPSSAGYDFWKPNPKQVEFARLPFSVFEAFYGGAIGGGKSELLLMLPILYRLHEHPRFYGIFFRRTLSQQDESLILRARYLYGKVGGTFNEAKRIFTFPNGGILRYTYLERDEHARDHDGAEYHYVAFDELTHFSKFQYIYITSRIRRAVSDLPVIIRCASNPGNIGHAWVRERFIEPCKEGGKILKDSEGNKRIFIKSLLKDNPYITEKDPEYIQRLNLMRENSEAEYEAKVNGNWWVFSGQVFTEFRPEKRDNEPENALHIIEPFKIPFYWPRIAAIDWGFAANTYCCVVAISPDARGYVYNEYCINYATISKWSREIAQMLIRDVDQLKTIFIDPSARKRDGQQEKSIFEQVMEGLGDELGSKLEYADNDRLSGKLLLHDLLRWKQRPKVKNITPGGFSEVLYNSLYRNISPRAAKLYFESFQPEEDETNIPRLLFFKGYTDIITKTIPLCVYNEDKGLRTRKKYEDVAEFGGDDPYDTLRYLAKGFDRYVTEVLKKDREVKTLESIHNRLHTTQDQTSYYMAMRLLDAEKRKFGHGSSVKRSGRRLLTR